MQAAVCVAFGEPLVVEEVELAPPGPGEVRVRLAACAVCHSDVAYASGAWGGDLPAIYGHEAAGIVEQVGDEAGQLAPGDHVVVTLVRACGPATRACAASRRCARRASRSTPEPARRSDGSEIVQGLRTAAFAEEIVVHHSQAVRIAREVPLDRACLLACGVITGYGAVVHTAGLTPGDSVAVIGAGGVGVNCIQGAVLAGAGPIAAVDLAPRGSQRRRHSARPTSSTRARRTCRRWCAASRRAAASTASWWRPAPPPPSRRPSGSCDAAAPS